MTRARCWNLRVNLDEFNAACWSLTSEEDRSFFLCGLLAGMNGAMVNHEVTNRFSLGYGIGKAMRSEAEDYRAAKAEIGKLGGRPGVSKVAQQGNHEDNQHGNHDGTQSPILNGTKKEKEIPLLPTASAPPSPPAKKEKKIRKVQTTALKPQSVEAFQAVWETPPKTHRKWDQSLRDYVDEPVSKGSRLAAERNFQGIVDSGVCPPADLYYAFFAYITEGKGPKDGFFQAVSTFYGPEKATWLEWLERGRELAKEVV